MHQSAPDEQPAESSALNIAQLQAIADELRDHSHWQTLLERQLVAVSRDTVREQPLPRVAEFAGILEQGIFEPRNRTPVTPLAMGTELRPDDDVLEMDATIPRGPDQTEEE